MKVLVRFMTAGTVENEVIEGHRITFQLKKRGRTKITVYDRRGRSIRDLAYRRVERIERLTKGGS